MANGAVPKMSAEDKKWQAKDDVSILTQAEAIKADKARMEAAKKMAAMMAEEAKKKADAMANLANGSKPNKSSDKKKQTPKTKKK